MRSPATDQALLERLWLALGGAPEALDELTLHGPERLLPSVYEVSALAAASIAASLLAIAELHAVRNDAARRRVELDRRHAAAAFRSERYLSALGWQLPAPWDAIAGDYPAQDGFIRLHTNYAHHRDAVLRVLGVAASREAIRAAVLAWRGEELEEAVVAAGGCAAIMRTPPAWSAHPQGRALAQESLLAIRTRRGTRPGFVTRASPVAPLAGVRVLDLTRVIAGPVCTRMLAGYGADVLRIDPPGFEEVGALLAETTVGKRRAQLNLREASDRDTFERLLTDADVLVHGYRSDALAKLGFGPERLRAINPNLISVSHDAYGFTGPWSTRRGFDSLVQMSCGIAWRGAEAAGSQRPAPLPAQALDHGTGYLLAAAACRSLIRLLTEQLVSDVRLSLAGTAKLLMDLGDEGRPDTADFSSADAEPWLEHAATAFGGIRRVRCPSGIEGVAPNWLHPAGPLGVDRASW
jgi:hypothetical protein